jgi:hypothetical protein
MSFASEVKLPEVYYDLCSRVIPGVYFILALRYLIYNSLGISTIIDLMLTVGLSYIIGFVTNPVSSRLCAVMENLAVKTHKPDAYTKEKEMCKHVTIFDRKSAQADKMHAEITGFVQLALLTIPIWVTAIALKRYSFWITTFVLLCLCVYFTWCAYDFAKRRYSRISTMINDNTLDK